MEWMTNVRVSKILTCSDSALGLGPLSTTKNNNQKSTVGNTVKDNRISQSGERGGVYVSWKSQEMKKWISRQKKPLSNKCRHAWQIFKVGLLRKVQNKIGRKQQKMTSFFQNFIVNTLQ